jgi:hypothetical protein
MSQGKKSGKNLFHVNVIIIYSRTTTPPHSEAAMKPGSVLHKYVGASFKLSAIRARSKNTLFIHL